ncbi:hypothetical protein CUJ84_Chr005079 [Rhizobium leguminosarum]|uniref:Uncharacterized protein n=1 Tax=Rhizobium leguminosarum TaxID=384 RepID=A0A2K9ZAW3_RHILE|nr:hypothetical protein CUJ84_Chr005079 [Rhizobium leguminosarum]
MTLLVTLKAALSLNHAPLIRPYDAGKISGCHKRLYTFLIGGG